MLCKKRVLRNLAKFTGKTLHQSPFLNKVVGFKPVTLSKKRPWHRSFHANFAKFLRTPFLIEQLRWLLLEPFLGCQSMWYFSRTTTFSRNHLFRYRRCHPQVYFFGARASLFIRQEGNVIFVTPTHIYRKYHIPTRFLLKIIFHFPRKDKKSYFLEKINTILPDVTKKIVFRRQFFGKTIFSEHLKKTSHFQVFFSERSSFLLCLKNENILLGKINTDNTMKIIFQCDFSGKTIFSKHLEKEDMVFRALSLLSFCGQQF